MVKMKGSLLNNKVFIKNVSDMVRIKADTLIEESAKCAEGIKTISQTTECFASDRFFIVE